MTVLSCTKCGATRTIRYKPKAKYVFTGICQCSNDMWRVE